jgi:hypothetical protein
MQSYTDVPFEICTIDHLYTNEEIIDHIHFIEHADSCEQTFSEQPFKNGKIIHEELSKTIYARIRPALPDIFTDRNHKKWQPIEATDYIFYSKLVENDVFGIHTDTGSVYDVKNQKYSKFTLLTYLNDDFTGGNTQFYDDRFCQTVTIVPKKNKTLLFDIDLFHQGNVIIRGTKYWIGTEIVCKLMTCS